MSLPFIIGLDGLVSLVIVVLRFTTKIFAIKEIHSVIDRTAKHMLETSEVLDDTKTWFFELDELSLGFTPEHKDQYLMLWVQNLKK